jgi:hypothetical protein
MSTWHRHHQSGPATDTRNAPERAIRFGCSSDLHPRGGTQTQHLNQDPPHHCDGPSWHRLLGTLLSSQGTDAHPFRSLDLPGGNRSNLAEPVCRVKLACQASFRGGTRFQVRTLQTTGERVVGRSVRGYLPGGPATELIFGVRSSLPGDIEKITQPAARRANPCPVTRVTSSEQALTCANAQ